MQSAAPSGLTRLEHEFDVCVIGGGMAGMCAAIAAARRGARTAIVHDRPVFGGNASSEVRMWICGAHGKHNKETGILEEIQLENCYRNPSLNYSIWDSVLYEKIIFQPNLTTFLNCSCVDARTDRGSEAAANKNRRIQSVRCWQLTTQTWHTIYAKQFIDCSGDSILAPLVGADYRVGREARHEYDEDIEPSVADSKTMGNSLLIQIRQTDEPQPFVPPSWAYKFNSPDDLPNRMRGVRAHNFWWIEVGGLMDTVADGETIHRELMRVVYGVWDYIKNRAPDRDQAAHWAVEWIGSLPGKRESRRYLGQHVLTQNDVRDHGRFADTVAYGGWSMDDHHPAGIYYPGKPTIFHAAPSPYGIPYRSLFSRNISNLLFAGRNISATHAALSSTRVMATCAIMGQAVGTAAALCITHACDPADVHASHLSQLQTQLMLDDCFLPGIARAMSELTAGAKITAPGAGVERLTDGMDRDRENENHAWTGPVGQPITLTWTGRVNLSEAGGGLRMVFDSNLLNDKRMPCTYPQKGDRCLVPDTMVRAYRIEAQQADGSWQPIHRETNNYQRLVRLPLNVDTAALRFVPEQTWGGGDEARLFALDVLEKSDNMHLPDRAEMDGPNFSQVVQRIAPEDLAPPENPGEPKTKPAGVSALAETLDDRGVGSILKVLANLKIISS